jgi:hypothetical protein
MITREELIKKLHGIEVIVDFTKKDGAARTMKCTLNLDMIASDKQPKGEKTIVDNGDTIRVFDLEKNDWRSFNYSTVTDINYN